MKNIKYIILTIICITAFSCGDDTFTRVFVDDEVKAPLTGTITLDTPNLFGSQAVNYTVTIPQSFAVESVVETTITSYVNAFEFNPFEEKVYDTIPAGSTTISSSFEMPDFDAEAPFEGIAEFASISLTGVALVQPDPDDIVNIGPVDDPYTLTSEPVILNLFADNPWIRSEPPTLLYSIDWVGPYDLNDLDLYLYNDDFSETFETSESGDRFEGDFINNPANEDYPDGDYIVEIAIWTSVDDTPIPYRLVFSYPDGTIETYEGTVDPAVGFVDPVIVTITTDAEGNKIYSTAAAS